jgi:hypothetical protein
MSETHTLNSSDSIVSIRCSRVKGIHEIALVLEEHIYCSKSVADWIGSIALQSQHVDLSLIETNENLQQNKQRSKGMHITHQFRRRCVRFDWILPILIIQEDGDLTKRKGNACIRRAT